jgi:hypothetical protein
MIPTRFSFVLVLSLMAVVRVATGQEAPPAETPAHIAIVDGQATIEHEAQVEPAESGMALAAGDRLRTDEGRLEVILGDGSVLHVDRHTTVDLQSDALLRLLEGRLLLVAGREAPKFRVDTPAASVSVQSAGEYRVSTLTGTMGSEIELAVLRGWAELRVDEHVVPVRAGERSVVRGNQLPSYPTAFNSATFDAFDRWSAQRRDAMLGTTSARYLPPDVSTYAGTFDRQGSWSSHPQYGYVWYPRVASSWRPYYNGYWRPTRRWGSLWVGWDPWAYPTHHFGRWGFSAAGAWFWIPQRRWAPAWVSWAAAPGFVGWCPLGFDGRPVTGFSVGVNFYAAQGIYDPWRAWTVLPHARFFRTPVSRFSVDPRRLDAQVRSAFSIQAGSPRPAGLAIPRDRVAGVGVLSSQSPVWGPSAISPVAGRMEPPARLAVTRGASDGRSPAARWAGPGSSAWSGPSRTPSRAVDPYARADRQRTAPAGPAIYAPAPQPSSSFGRSGRVMDRMALPRSADPQVTAPHTRPDRWPPARQWRDVRPSPEPLRSRPDGWGTPAPYDGFRRPTPPGSGASIGGPQLPGRPDTGRFAVPRGGMTPQTPASPAVIAPRSAPPAGAQTPRAGVAPARPASGGQGSGQRARR